jgi:uncharacterized protein with GYD domain
MPLYFLVGTLTEQGQRMVQSNPDLPVEAVREVQADGAQVLSQYAVLGRCDFVMLVEADDNQAVAKLSLEVGVRVGMHIETLPALAVGVLSDGEERAELEETGVEMAQDAAESSGEWRIPSDGPESPESK